VRGVAATDFERLTCAIRTRQAYISPKEKGKTKSTRWPVRFRDRLRFGKPSNRVRHRVYRFIHITTVDEHSYENAARAVPINRFVTNAQRNCYYRGPARDVSFCVHNTCRSIISDTLAVYGTRNNIRTVWRLSVRRTNGLS